VKNVVVVKLLKIVFRLDANMAGEVFDAAFTRPMLRLLTLFARISINK
jgi:hypothetical protein